jgi:lambda repressor-like predicted transcriptional regulator
MPSRFDPIDIKAILARMGRRIASLAREAGASPNMVQRAMYRPSVAGERVLLKALGIANGHTVWPDRYASDGTQAGHPRPVAPPVRLAD